MKRSLTAMVVILALFSLPLVIPLSHANASINPVQSTYSECDTLSANVQAYGYFSYSCVLNFSSSVSVGNVIAFEGILNNDTFDAFISMSSYISTTVSAGSVTGDKGLSCDNGSPTCGDSITVDGGFVQITDSGIASSINADGLNVTVTLYIFDGNYAGSPPVATFDSFGVYGVELPNIDASNYASNAAVGSGGPYTTSNMELPANTTGYFVLGATMVAGGTSGGVFDVNASFTDIPHDPNGHWQNLTGGAANGSGSTRPTIFYSNGDTGLTGDWITIGFVYGESSTVTQPITCTLAESGPSTPTIAVSDSASSISPTTMTCPHAGSTVNFSVASGATVTLTQPTPGANTQYLFSGGATSVSFVACNSGTCGGHSASIYYAVKNTFEVTANAQATFDSGMVATFISNSYGGTINPCIATTTAAASDSCTGYSEYGVAVTAPHFLTIPPANSQWQNHAGSSSTAGTPTTAGNTYNTNYYKQLLNTYQATPSSPSAWNAAGSVAVTGTLLGTASQPVCTITVSNGGGAASCSSYADYDSAVSLATPVTIGGASWSAVGSTSFTQTTGGNTNNVDYQHLTASFTITLTKEFAGQTTTSVSVTGCGVSPGSVSSNGVAQPFITSEVSCLITVTGYSAGNYVYAFNDSGSPSLTWTFTICSSGPCGNYAKVLYEQYAMAVGIGSYQSWTGSGTIYIYGLFLGVNTTMRTCTVAFDGPKTGSCVTNPAVYGYGFDVEGYASYTQSVTLNGTKWLSIDPFGSLKGDHPITIHVSYPVPQSEYYLAPVAYYMPKTDSAALIQSKSCSFSLTTHNATATAVCTLTSPVSMEDVVVVSGLLGANVSSQIFCIGATIPLVGTPGACDHAKYGNEYSQVYTEPGGATASPFMFGVGTSKNGTFSVLLLLYSTGLKAAFTLNVELQEWSGYGVYTLPATNPPVILQGNYGTNSQHVWVTGTPGAGMGTQSVSGVERVTFFGVSPPSGLFVGSVVVSNDASYTTSANSPFTVHFNVGPAQTYYAATGYAGGITANFSTYFMALSPSSSYVSYAPLTMFEGPIPLGGGPPTTTSCVSYQLVGGGSFDAPSYTYYDAGNVSHTVTLTRSPVCYTVLAGSSYSVPSLLSGISDSAQERAITANSTSAVVTSGVFVYWHQLDVPVSYTITDGTATNHPTFTYLAFASPVTVTNQKYATSYWIDYNSHWTAQDPFTTSPDFVMLTAHPPSGQAASLQPIIVAYFASSSCGNPNPLTEIENGCVIPGIVGAWSYATGAPAWFGFILLGINVAIYNRSQSVWLSLLILWVSGAVFSAILPVYVGQVAQVFLYLGSAGLAVKTILLLR